VFTLDEILRFLRAHRKLLRLIAIVLRPFTNAGMHSRQSN
jgi:hypothetical protein